MRPVCQAEDGGRQRAAAVYTASRWDFSPAGVVRKLIVNLSGHMADFYEAGCQDALTNGSRIPGDCYMAYGGQIERTFTSIVQWLPKVPRYSAPQAPAESWIMPNEIGKDLATAGHDIQALVNPNSEKREDDVDDKTTFIVTTSKDLTGQGRRQTALNYWQVCSSTPPPGEPFASQTNVIFGVVLKDKETCP